MGVNRVGGAERDIDMTAIGLPSGLAGGEVLVGVGDAAVVLFAEFVVGRIGIWVAAKPELLDERVALFIVREIPKGLTLFVRNDVGDVLIEPCLVGALQLLTDCPLRLDDLLVAAGPLQRVGVLVLAGGLSVRRRIPRLGSKTGCGRED